MLELFLNIYHSSSHPSVPACFRAGFRQGDCRQRTMQHFLSAIFHSGTAPELPWAHLPGPAQTNLRSRGQEHAQLCLSVQPAGSSLLVHPQRHGQASGEQSGSETQHLFCKAQDSIRALPMLWEQSSRDASSELVKQLLQV